MATNLIIVESPAKTKTLKNFLGPSFRAEASMGHIRDLPQHELGVAVDEGFKPKYVTIPERRDVLARLKEAAGKADNVYLASDPDREGEAIASHLAQALKLKDPQRIEFNEITRGAVLDALKHPRSIDDRRVDAQEARRVLDRLVGYKLSPLLWKKVRKGLSAGRVQSVAVRLVCDREREILAFIPVEYWSLTATLTPQPPEPRFPFDAKLIARGGSKLELHNEAETNEVVEGLSGAPYDVSSVKRREQRRNPAPPFITSTLQQEASRKLGFSNKRTMQTAQKLYEGIELGAEGPVGLITYMRTDSARVSSEAQKDAREFILAQYGEGYAPARPTQYRAKGAAQDAHEAIRPTSVSRTPEAIEAFLNPDQRRLYRLIWQRFIASQMAPAVFDVTTADIKAAAYTFRATGSVRKFDGFMRVYTEGKDTEDKPDEEREPLPALSVGQTLDLIKLDPRQHFTEPPPRYTEATLVKALEEQGIGRPSTYASIISTILDRTYVALEERRFKPTDLGFTVNDLLVEHFPEVMDVGFTAGLETSLDEVEEGHAERTVVLSDFYGTFSERVDAAHANMKRVKPEQVETEHVCPACGKKMMLRQSDRGPFLGCSGFPKCKTVLNADGTAPERPERAAPVLSDQACPKCGKPMVERRGRYGKFLGCSAYPKCRGIVRLAAEEGDAEALEAPADEKVGVTCPKDGGDVIVKRTRRNLTFYGCSNYPACDFSTWHRPVGRACPTCGWPLGEQSYRGRATGVVKCTNADCDYEERASE